MMDDSEMQKVVRTATMVSFGMVKELLDKQPTYTSRKEARAKYKGLLEIWERSGLIKGIPTEGGKHTVYATHRLVELYEIWLKE